jgi:hypothetical protein
MEAAIYPKVTYWGMDVAANYNLSREKACNEFNKPFYSVFTENKQLREKIDPNNNSIDYGKDCTAADELSSQWKGSWKNKYASDSTTVSNARWAIYFSPPCNQTLVAAVTRHWENGMGGLDYYFYFKFNDENKIEWMSVSWIHSSTITPPLKGWYN